MRTLSNQEIYDVSGGGNLSDFFSFAQQSADALLVPPILRPVYYLALLVGAIFDAKPGL